MFGFAIVALIFAVIGLVVACGAIFSGDDE
jgi:hypothetical protein